LKNPGCATALLNIPATSAACADIARCIQQEIASEGAQTAVAARPEFHNSVMSCRPILLILLLSMLLQATAFGSGCSMRFGR
jgi:hypothetical protein